LLQISRSNVDSTLKEKETLQSELLKVQAEKEILNNLTKDMQSQIETSNFLQAE